MLLISCTISGECNPAVVCAPCRKELGSYIQQFRLHVIELRILVFFGAANYRHRIGAVHHKDKVHLLLSSIIGLDLHICNGPFLIRPFGFLNKLSIAIIQPIICARLCRRPSVRCNLGNFLRCIQKEFSR